MEINITWNCCRICLYEPKTSTFSSTGINTDTADKILELTGVKIKTNDSLPQKICSKCCQILKQAIQFRETCRNTDTYLQNILEKTKSFKLDKPNKNVLDDIIEESAEYEEHLLEDCEGNDSKENNEKIDSTNLAIYLMNMEPQQKKKKRHPSVDVKNETGDIDLELNNESGIAAAEDDLLTMPPEETLMKPNMDFGSIFLNNESDMAPDDSLLDDKELESDGDFTKTVRDNDSDNHNIEENKINFLQDYKSLKMNVAEEDEVQDEILQSGSNISTVDIVSNEDNNEFFFIFSDDVIANKAEGNDTKDDTLLDENMSDMVDNIADDASNEEGNFIELLDSESNTLDQIDRIDEGLIARDESRSRETSPNNENENSYQQDDMKEHTTVTVQYKTQYISQKTNEYEKSEGRRESYMTKTTVSKTINYECQICSNRFSNKSLLKYHMRIMHARNERNYECELCGKRFTAACNLTTHMRTHTGEKPFVCQYCQRRFSDKSTHVKHERSHTDERPYSCTICQKAFTLSSSLKAHKRVHTGEKPYNCISCGKSFKLPHQLKAHLSTNAHKIRTDEVITLN